MHRNLVVHLLSMLQLSPSSFVLWPAEHKLALCRNIVYTFVDSSYYCRMDPGCRICAHGMKLI